MAKTNKKELIEQHIQSAKECDWDDLALTIIALEGAERKEKDPKVLELLKIKLKIYEAEKSSRVFQSFNMEYFLNKDMEIFEDGDYDFSDI
jgi:hypothetical protein